MSIKEKFEQAKERFPSGDEIKRVPTQSRQLNNLLSKDDEEVKGIPLGRYLAMYAREGTGKTTLALEICRSFAEEGYASVFLDSEEGITQSFIEDLGLGEYYGDLFFYHKNVGTYDDLEDLVDMYLEEEELGLIVLDSLKSVSPPKEDDENITDREIGEEARLDDQFLSTYNSYFAKNDVSMMFIQQMRTNINVSGYGQTRDEISAGNAFKYYMSIIMKLRQTQKYLDDNNDLVSADIEITTEKNKTATEDTVTIPLKYGDGFDPVLMVFRYFEENESDIDWFEKNGGWYTVYDTETGEEWDKLHGRSQFKEFIETNQDTLVERLEQTGVI